MPSMPVEVQEQVSKVTPYNALTNNINWPAILQARQLHAQLRQLPLKFTAKGLYYLNKELLKTVRRYGLSSLAGGSTEFSYFPVLLGNLNNYHIHYNINAKLYLVRWLDTERLYQRDNVKSIWSQEILTMTPRKRHESCPQSKDTVQFHVHKDVSEYCCNEITKKSSFITTALVKYMKVRISGKS